MSSEPEPICTYCGRLKDMTEFQIPVTLDAGSELEKTVITYSTVCAPCRRLLYERKMRRVRSHR